MNKLREAVHIRKIRKDELTRILKTLKDDLYKINDESNELFSIAFKINQLQQRCTLLKLKKSSFDIYKSVLNDIKNDIPNTIKKYGCSFDLFLKYFNISYNIPYTSMLCNTFHIYKIEELQDDETVPELDPTYNESAKTNDIFFRKIYPPFKNTLDENINGSKIFIPYQKSYLIVYGYFKDMLGFGLRSINNYSEIKNKMQNNKQIDKKFTESFLGITSLRDILVNTPNEFMTHMKNANKDMRQIEMKSFNEVQKSFQNSSIFKQRRIILLLLLSEEKSKQYCVPLLESLKHNQDIFEIKKSLGTLGNNLYDIKTDIQSEIKQYESSYDDISYQSKIMMLKVDKHVKTKALEKLKEANSGRESGTKAQQYLDGLLKIPFGIYNKESIFNNTVSDYEKTEYLRDVRDTLDNCVHGHKEAKRHIERLLGQWMKGKHTGTVFGFQGPPGTGKTTLAKHGFAKCLVNENGETRPIAFIPIGGTSSGSYLEGHGYTYMGSTWGKIVDVLIETQCMNPIIYIDELDKISQSERGQELIGILTHLTDSTQNDEFNDKYFSGVKFDLSQALFVFSYNDSSKIDRILRDRITEIQTSGLFKNDKIVITNKFLLKEIYHNMGLSNGEVIINDTSIQYLIDNFTYEAGVRKLKEKLYDVIREVNLLYIDKQITYPFQITEKFIANVFEDKPKMILPKMPLEPSVGLVNGLYATNSGLGGITMIQVHKSYGENLELVLTGSQGKVMKESMECAKTVALSKINEIDDRWKSFKLHIHCPEAATAKDGPSAGITITTCIYSRLMNIPVRHDFAMTGEIDLNGNVHPIGGVESKIFGAIQSNIFNIIFPKSNERDVLIFKKKYTTTYETICIYFADHIDEIFKLVLIR